MNIWENREKWEIENFQTTDTKKRCQKVPVITKINLIEVSKVTRKQKSFNLYKKIPPQKMKVSSIHIDDKVLYSLQSGYEKFHSSNDYPQIKKIADIVIDNDRGSIRKLLPVLIKELREKALSGSLTDEEIAQRRIMRQKKYCTYDEINTTDLIVVTENGYAFDFKTGKIWKSKLPSGQHVRQSKLMGK